MSKTGERYEMSILLSYPVHEVLIESSSSQEDSGITDSVSNGGIYINVHVVMKVWQFKGLLSRSCFLLIRSSVPS